ncbi:MAG: DUF5320 domain-containing protein [Promethearchaeota archaeon]
MPWGDGTGPWGTGGCGIPGGWRYFRGGYKRYYGAYGWRAWYGSYGFGGRGWRNNGPYPGNGPFSNLPPYERPGWRYRWNYTPTTTYGTNDTTTNYYPPSYPNLSEDDKKNFLKSEKERLEAIIKDIENQLKESEENKTE